MYGCVSKKSSDNRSRDPITLYYYNIFFPFVFTSGRPDRFIFFFSINMYFSYVYIYFNTNVLYCGDPLNDKNYPFFYSVF